VSAEKVKVTTRKVRSAAVKKKKASPAKKAPKARRKPARKAA
jgi:hypothetical protein